MARLHGSTDDLVDVLLDDRRVPAVDAIDLGVAHVHADHEVAVVGETRGRDAADVAQSEDADVVSHTRTVVNGCLRGAASRTSAQMSANWVATCCHPKRARTCAAARLPSAAASSGSRNRRTTALANASGVSAM